MLFVYQGREKAIWLPNPQSTRHAGPIRRVGITNSTPARHPSPVHPVRPTRLTTTWIRAPAHALFDHPVCPTRLTTVWILEPTQTLFAHYMTTASPLSAAFDYSPIIADSLRLHTPFLSTI